MSDSSAAAEARSQAIAAIDRQRHDINQQKGAVENQIYACQDEISELRKKLDECCAVRNEVNSALVQHEESCKRTLTILQQNDFDNRLLAGYVNKMSEAFSIGAKEDVSNAYRERLNYLDNEISRTEDEIAQRENEIARYRMDIENLTNKDKMLCAQYRNL